MEQTRLSPTRIYLLLLLLILTPWFFPEARDLMTSWYHRSGAATTVEELRGDAAPATVAVIRQARADWVELTSDSRVTAFTEEQAEVATPPVDDFSLSANGCTLSARQVEAILSEYGSPATGVGLGEHSVLECQRTGIDNGVVVSMFIKESGAGAAPGWAGRKPDGSTTGNTSNIIALAGQPAYGRFRDFGGDWKAGTTAHFDLLAFYRDELGKTSVRDAITTWAPAEDSNDPDSYASFVEGQLREWRVVNSGNFVADGPEAPALPVQPVEAPAVTASTSISIDGGPFGQNVRSVINSSPDLQEVTIQPGGSFSFNERWRINGDGNLTTYVVYGGGACNVAGTFSNVARQLGLTPVFSHHGVKLNELPWEDAVSIWSAGARGGQDLIIDNASGRTLRFQAELGETTLTVSGWLE